jgi:tetratricopeptide (TPR) repeat protein
MESLGNALLGAGKDDEALAAYSDLVNAGGNSPSAQRAMGRIMARRRNIAEAVAHYTAALDLSGGSPAIRIELADLLLESGDVAGAGANYREAWLSAEGSAESLYAEGRMREVAGERDQAMLLYQRALKARALAPETLDTVQRRLGGGKQD